MQELEAQLQKARAGEAAGRGGKGGLGFRGLGFRAHVFSSFAGRKGGGIRI